MIEIIINKKDKLGINDIEYVVCPVCGDKHEESDRHYGVCPKCKVTIYD